MATLTISALALGMDAGRIRVHIRLADGGYNTVAGTYGSGSIVERITEYTASDGTLSVDLVPNASITPANTYYVVWVGQERFLIEKSAATQTLSAALVADPNVLESVLATTRLSDVSDTAATTGQVLVSNGTSYAPALVDTASIASEAVTSAKIDASVETRVHGRPMTSAMRGFVAALADADATPVDIVVVGDSLSEDWQWVDSGTSESVGLRSWVRLFEVDLANRFAGGAVGVGWMPIRAGLGTNPGWDTVTGSAVTDRGLGQYAVQLDAGEYAEHTEICDGVDLYFDEIASTCTIHVDSVLTATLTASAVPTVWSSGALTAGSHTIKVTAAGGQAFPYGSYWYLGNRTTGVRVHNGGHSGWGPLDHTNKTGTLEHIALIDPDCVIVPIGAAANNPPTSAGGGFDSGLAAYTANITALLEAIETEAPTAAIVHVAEHAFTGRSATWPAFAAASRQLAVDGGWGFADCYETIGYVGGDTYGFAIFDEVHLTAKGHRVMADTILAALVGSTSRVDGAVLSAPPGDTADIWLASGTGTRARLASILGTVGWYLRRATDTEERGVFSDTGMAWGSGSAAVDTVIQRVSAGLLAVTGALRFTEQPDPSAPAANTGVLYVRDNGAGKTELCVRFSSGAVQVIATQP